MSISSSALKPKDRPKLQQAIEATRTMDYFQWRNWMRRNFKYSVVVRMAIFIGMNQPSKELYGKLKEFGSTSAAIGEGTPTLGTH